MKRRGSADALRRIAVAPPGARTPPGIALCVALLVACASPPSQAAEIHRCPQPDGTTRFQDRPCGPPPARPVAAAGESTRREATPIAPARTRPNDRREYLASTEQRCRDGDRRACAAAACERSGRLDSPACQDAVGYARGPGWTLRPATDLFDPRLAVDAFTLACVGGGRRATLTRARGETAWRWQGRPDAPPVDRDGLSKAATEFCDQERPEAP